MFTGSTYSDYKKVDDDRLDKLGQIKKRVRQWYDYWEHNNQYYRAKVSFLQGDQWDSGTANYFALAKIPEMRVNYIYMITNQTISDHIQNLPELSVIPKNMYVEQDKIELFQDLVRTSFINSGGEEQIQKCVVNQMCGQAAIQIGTRYIDPLSFQQECFFDLINDPTHVGFDCSAKDMTFSDGDYCFRMRFLNKSEWKKEFPDIPFEAKGFEGFAYTQNTIYSSNKSEDQCVVCEFYWKEYKNATIVRVSPTIDGKPYEDMEEKDFDDYLSKFMAKIAQERLEHDFMGQIYLTPRLPQIIDRKRDKKYTIKCYMCRDDKILDDYKWIGKDLPIVFIDGNGYELDEKWQIKAFFHEAEDLQRALNYQWTMLVQFLKTSMKGKVFATPEQMKGFEQIYRNPELYHGAIPYNWIQAVGQPPHVIDAPQLKQEMLLAIQQTTMQLMALMGKNDAAQSITPTNVQSTPLSGKAYEMMSMQQYKSSFRQFSNLFKGLQQVGNIFLNIIPQLYTDVEMITVYNKDKQSRQVLLNVQNPQTGETENEVKPIQATVSVTAAPSFEMQAQQTRDYLVNLLEAGARNPQMFSLVADQMAQLGETKITPVIVRRLKTMVPPQALAADKGQEFQPPPPQPDPMMMLKQQELQLKSQQMQQDMQSSAVKHQIDMAKLKQDQFNSLLDAHKNGIKTQAEVEKAKIGLNEAIINAHHKIHMTREQHAHQQTMQYMQNESINHKHQDQ